MYVCLFEDNMQVIGCPKKQQFLTRQPMYV